jgi:hypothetical protein
MGKVVRANAALRGKLDQSLPYDVGELGLGSYP